MVSRICPLTFLYRTSQTRWTPTVLPYGTLRLRVSSTLADRRHLRVFADRNSEPNYSAKAEEAFAILSRRKSKSWNRFRDLVQLSVAETLSGLQRNPNPNSSGADLRTFTDIGCDHGLLPASLVLSGRFDKVLGVDCSLQALQDGAFQLNETIAGYFRIRQSTTETDVVSDVPPLEFRHGNGLKVVRPGEADVLCLSGMGVNTMIKILSATNSESDHSPPTRLLDACQCRRLILQPTNIRPRNLILLYHALHDLGWVVEQERIAHLSSKWYFSIAFRHKSKAFNESVKLPGYQLADHLLMTRDRTNHQYRDILDYLEHHCAWLRQDRDTSSGLRGGEEEWLGTFEKVLTDMKSLESR